MWYIVCILSGDWNLKPILTNFFFDFLERRRTKRNKLESRKKRQRRKERERKKLTELTFLKRSTLLGRHKKWRKKFHHFFFFFHQSHWRISRQPNVPNEDIMFEISYWFFERSVNVALTVLDMKEDRCYTASSMTGPLNSHFDDRILIN